MFGSFTAFVTLIIMFFYVFGGKKRKKASSAHSSRRDYRNDSDLYASSNIDEDFIDDLDGDDDFSDDFDDDDEEDVYEQVRKYLAKTYASLIPTGDFIERRNGRERKFRNTALDFIADEFWLYTVDDYAGLKDGTAVVDDTSVSFYANKIGATQVVRDNNSQIPVRLIIGYDNPAYDDGLIFEFRGSDSYLMAIEARQRILELTQTYLMKQYN